MFLVSKGDDSNAPKQLSLNPEVIENISEQALIYRRDNLTPFQQKVNSAAVDLALQNPVLIQKGNRGELLNKARARVADEGYNFKKGKSRSRIYGDGNIIENTQSDQNLMKR